MLKAEGYGCLNFVEANQEPTIRGAVGVAEFFIRVSVFGELKSGIGNFSNLQDGVIGHLSDEKPLIVGNYVTVGHGAIIHACRIEDECLIGMNATVLDGAVVGKQSIVAAGTVVPAGMLIPSGSLVAGVPGTIKRQLGVEQRNGLKKWAEKYLEVAKAHQEL